MTSPDFPTNIDVATARLRDKLAASGPHLARDIARIDRVLLALRAAWMAAPDLRLGQLLATAFPAEHRPSNSDQPMTDEQAQAAMERAMYFLEDDHWEHALQLLAQQIQSSPSSP